MFSDTYVHIAMFLLLYVESLLFLGIPCSSIVICLLIESHIYLVSRDVYFNRVCDAQYFKLYPSDVFVCGCSVDPTAKK